MNNNSFKSGFVSLVGRPNVGKSTLLNQLVNAKVSIVTPKAQTTRNQIQGILTTEKEQIIFVDTPGIHNSFNELGNVMNEMAYDTFSGMDLIVFLVDASLNFSDLDSAIIDKLNATKTPIILVFNKIDIVKDKEKIEKLLDAYSTLSYQEFCTISALNSTDTTNLLAKITTYLPNGPMYYPEDQYANQSVRFMVGEIIREKILLLTQKEIPHSTAIEVESFKYKSDDLVEIRAEIIVERPSQKKIMIGEKGQMIKEIGRLSRLEIAEFLNCKVYLELFVKVEADWRNRGHYLKMYGYQKPQK